MFVSLVLRSGMCQVLLRRSPRRSSHIPKILFEEEAIHLLVADVSHKVLVLYLGNPLEITTPKSGEQPCASHAVRLLDQSLQALQDHEDRVVAADVIGPPVLDPVLPPPVSPA